MDSDGEEGLFRLREVGDISDEEAPTAFSSDKEEEEERTPDVGGIHMLAAAGDLYPGPTYSHCDKTCHLYAKVCDMFPFR